MPCVYSDNNNNSNSNNQDDCCVDNDHDNDHNNDDDEELVFAMDRLPDCIPATTIDSNNSNDCPMLPSSSSSSMSPPPSCAPPPTRNLSPLPSPKLHQRVLHLAHLKHQSLQPLTRLSTSTQLSHMQLSTQSTQLSHMQLSTQSTLTESDGRARAPLASPSAELCQSPPSPNSFLGNHLNSVLARQQAIFHPLHPTTSSASSTTTSDGSTSSASSTTTSDGSTSSASSTTTSDDSTPLALEAVELVAVQHNDTVMMGIEKDTEKDTVMMDIDHHHQPPPRPRLSLPPPFLDTAKPSAAASRPLPYTPTLPSPLAAAMHDGHAVHHSIHLPHSSSASLSSTSSLRPRSMSAHRDSISMHGGGELYGRFVGTYEESILNGRLSTPPSRPLPFVCQIGALAVGKCKASLKCRPHVTIPFNARFYEWHDTVTARRQQRSTSSASATKHHGSTSSASATKHHGSTSSASATKHHGSTSSASATKHLDVDPNDMDVDVKGKGRMHRRKSDSMFTAIVDELGTPYVGTVDLEWGLGVLNGYGQPDASEAVPPNDYVPGAYRIPPRGQLQILVKNPDKVVVKVFLVPYDFRDMPVMTRTFLRQKTYSVAQDADQSDQRGPIRFAVHLQFICLPSNFNRDTPATTPVSAVSSASATSIPDHSIPSPQNEFDLNTAHVPSSPLPRTHVPSATPTASATGCTWPTDIQNHSTVPAASTKPPTKRIYLYKSIRVVFSHRVADGDEKLVVSTESPSAPVGPFLKSVGDVIESPSSSTAATLLPPSFSLTGPKVTTECRDDQERNQTVHDGGGCVGGVLYTKGGRGRSISSPSRVRSEEVSKYVPLEPSFLASLLSE